MSEEVKPKFVVGRCARCNQEIDNAVEGFVTDSDGKIYHDECYRELHGS